MKKISKEEKLEFLKKSIEGWDDLPEEIKKEYLETAYTFVSAKLMEDVRCSECGGDSFYVGREVDTNRYSIRCKECGVEILKFEIS